jgi:peptidoglycan-associated lipoprotein
VKNSIMKMLMLITVVTALALLAGCAKRVAKASPPPPPAPTAPTATLSASPSALQHGQSTQLTWHTANANDINITGLGTVPASGTRTVTPDNSTTYRLSAKGPGGTAEASARVTVTAPPAPVVSQLSEQELFARNVKDVFFDFNQYDLRSDEQTVVTSDAQFLAQHPNIKVLVEGHCDDRGSEEYNLALGSNRAESIKDYLVRMGVSADRIRTISYGKEKPFCNQQNDQCWQSNRRDHFTFQQ